MMAAYNSSWDATPTNTVSSKTCADWVMIAAGLASACITQTGLPLYLSTAKTLAPAPSGTPCASVALPPWSPRISRFPAIAGVERAVSPGTPV